MRIPLLLSLTVCVSPAFAGLTFTLNPSTYSATTGSTITTIGTLANTGPQTLSWRSASCCSYTGADLSLSRIALQWNSRSLAPGQSITAPTWQLALSPTAAPGAYTVQQSFTFTDNTNTIFTVTAEFTVTVPCAPPPGGAPFLMQIIPTATGFNSCPPQDFSQCLNVDSSGNCLMNAVQDSQSNQFQLWCMKPVLPNHIEWWYNFSYFSAASGTYKFAGKCPYEGGQDQGLIYYNAPSVSSQPSCFVRSVWQVVDGGLFDDESSPVPYIPWALCPGCKSYSWIYTFDVASNMTTSTHIDPTGATIGVSIQDPLPDFNSLPPVLDLSAIPTGGTPMGVATPGDVNVDGKVDCTDVNIVRAALGTSNGEPGFVAGADLNGDGVVDQEDLAILLQNLSPGTVCPNLPFPISTSVPSGTGANQTFTFTFADSAGWQSLAVVNILINNFLDGRHACYVALVPLSASAGSVFLVDDAGDAAGPYQGLVLPGNGTAGNTQCSIGGIGSSMSASGNTLTLVLSISFSNGFEGNKIAYLAARDTAGNNSGWKALRVWQVPGSPETTTTTVLGMAPARGTGTSATPFTFTFSDTKGYQDLGVINILINSFLDGRQGCYLAYSQPLNTLYLVNNPGTALLPGQPLSKSGVTNNSQCAVSWGTSAVGVSNNNLTLTLNIAFSPSFGGNRVVYLAARDVNELNNTDWQPQGTWLVQ